MQTIFVIAILVLGFIVTFQIAKASEYVAVLRGLETSRKQSNRINAALLLVFLIVGLIGVFYANAKLKGKILGAPASDHGVLVDRMLYVTLAITIIVFFVTQILLFWFSFKYQESDKRKAFYFPHNNKLEVIWTAIPAITLTILVGFGIFYWYKITGKAPKEAMVVEVVGKQFGWMYRYPGADKELGRKYFKNINAENNNPLGQIWEDGNNHDDVFVEQEMHLVVNKPVKLVIGAQDVIHSVGLPHFRLKTDAVPGTPTTMWFTPTKTTKQMKEETGNPDFTFELACDQMCGRGHWSMRGTIIVETQEEFDMWLASKKPQYLVANPDKDPSIKKDTVATPAPIAAVIK
ncbi:MAG TPA: cytochrome c oxidase subunit II [Chitinophagaceae bacterium]|jgi:cytochrome c oxidase subunit 2|nr:cytochrome c oxidase subunit II [Chitinophagaceae bacterium]HMU58604.1 cytochrome c oxidase subunit II [Chitinophagaceae bacterium]